MEEGSADGFKLGLLDVFSVGTLEVGRNVHKCEGGRDGIMDGRDKSSTDGEAEERLDGSMDGLQNGAVDD